MILAPYVWAVTLVLMLISMPSLKMLWIIPRATFHTMWSTPRTKFRRRDCPRKLLGVQCTMDGMRRTEKLCFTSITTSSKMAATWSSQLSTYYCMNLSRITKLYLGNWGWTWITAGKKTRIDTCFLSLQVWSSWISLKKYPLTIYWLDILAMRQGLMQIKIKHRHSLFFVHLRL